MLDESFVEESYKDAVGMAKGRILDYMQKTHRKTAPVLLFEEDSNLSDYDLEFRDPHYKEIHSFVLFNPYY